MKSFRVLLVEDDELVADTVHSILDANNIECERAGRLSAACGVLENNGIDLVLLDLTLPDAFGLDGLRQLRKLFPLVPVVIVTGHNDADTAIRAIQLGAQEYIAKPLPEPAVFIRILTHAVARHRAQRQGERTEARSNKTLVMAIIALLASVFMALREILAFLK